MRIDNEFGVWIGELHESKMYMHAGMGEGS